MANEYHMIKVIVFLHDKIAIVFKLLLPQHLALQKKRKKKESYSFLPSRDGRKYDATD